MLIDFSQNSSNLYIEYYCNKYTFRYKLTTIKNIYCIFIYNTIDGKFITTYNENGNLIKKIEINDTIKGINISIANNIVFFDDF
jgi:hypothetical protein